MRVLLIVPDPDTIYRVTQHESVDVAKEAKGDAAWAIVGWIEVDSYRVRFQTVSYFNIPVGPFPIGQQWIDIRSV